MVTVFDYQLFDFGKIQQFKYLTNFNDFIRSFFGLVLMFWLKNLTTVSDICTFVVILEANFGQTPLKISPVSKSWLEN